LSAAAQPHAWGANIRSANPPQACGENASTDAVEISGIARSFGDVQALCGVDLRVAQGEFFGLLGPNGAGKTTLISILAGLTRADRGTARILGHDVVTDYREARRVLGVVPQELVFDPFFTVRETLRIQSGYFGLRHNDAWIDELLHHLDLVQKADANMRSLSGGMKRRVLVGQALVHKPPVIVLDEPTAGVDVELRQSLWAFIRKLNREGHTIILTTHYLEEAEALCGRIAMMKAGRIVALDTTRHLLSRFAGLTVRLAAERLPAEWASRLHRREGSVHYLGLENYDELERLLASLRIDNIAIDELSLAETDLEQVFLRIMAGTETTDDVKPVVEVPES
jgi:ABC-2 type transport system ATP-binding protein